MARKINFKKLQAVLAEAEQAYQQEPHFWPTLVTIARCRYWLGDPTAAQYFRQAAHLFPLRPHGSPYERIKIGNYYRLAGDQDQADHYFTQAKHCAETSPLSDSDIPMFQRVLCAFLLRDDTEVERLVEQKKPDKRTMAPATALLARARRTGDLPPAYEAVQKLEAHMHGSHQQPWHDHVLPLWDVYTIGSNIITNITNGEEH